MLEYSLSSYSNKNAFVDSLTLNKRLCDTTFSMPKSVRKPFTFAFSTP